VEMKPGSGGVAAAVRVYEMPGTNGNMGRLSAYDTKTMQRVWTFQFLGSRARSKNFLRSRRMTSMTTSLPSAAIGFTGAMTAPI